MPARPLTDNRKETKAGLACLLGRTDRRHHMQRVLAQHGARKVEFGPNPNPNPNANPNPNPNPTLT